MTGITELARLIEDVSGNMLPEREHTRLGELAERRRRATGLRDLESYIRLLRLDLNGAEWRHLLSGITINESFLFRAPQQFRAVAESAIPELTARRLPGGTLHLWSAGCARGEEAVTLAITCAESRHLLGWGWQILATDVDEAALEDARKGRYGQRAVAKVPQELLAKYFTARGQEYELDPVLRQHISFRPCNLIGRHYELQPDAFDLVFLRNVLIYFRTELQQQVVTSVAATLNDDGYLFLGPSESLWQLTNDLVAVDLGDCFCYRHAGAVSGDDAEKRARSSRAAVGRAAAAAAVIGTCSDALPPLPPPLKAPRPERDKAVAAESSTGNGAQPLRTRVVIPIVEAIAQGRIAPAQELLREATQRFPESPMLRALEGLACDVQQLTDAALKGYRAALYLDPTLYQVRYLLARCMERMGWQQRAQREYREVLACLLSAEAKDVEDWAVLGMPSRAQVEAACTKVVGRT